MPTPSPLDRDATRLDTPAPDSAVIELPADADWRDLADIVAGLERIDIRFDSFKDGRGFTLAAQLREKLGYRGALRATGHVLPDQARFLQRVGFTDIAPDDPGDDEDWRRALRRFPLNYQPGADKAGSIREARREEGPGAGPRLSRLNRLHGEASAEEILRTAVKQWPGRIAMLSSFGAEAAVGLHLLSRVAPDTPVLFLDTGKHFAQTEQYRRELTERLGLSDVRLLRPDAAQISAEDASGELWKSDPDACCDLRKVRPLDKALAGFDALITGRKRFHGGERLALPVFEESGERVRVNPLARWREADIEAAFKAHDLPRHPLTELGYRSIGCWTCTAPVQAQSGPRDGRWSGQGKTECGIHAPAFMRKAG